MMNCLRKASLLDIICIEEVSSASQFIDNQFEPEFKILVDYDKV